MLGGEPNDVTFVPVDFTREDLRERLREAGHDEASATLFVWSGFAPYLPEDAVAAVLGWVGRHSNPRTSIVFDACWAGAIEAIREYFGSEELKRAVAEVGEPLGGSPRAGSRRPSPASVSPPRTHSTSARQPPPT
jgi:O-methyltransferase involved in polyketide biosynthesis